MGAFFMDLIFGKVSNKSENKPRNIIKYLYTFGNNQI